MRRSQRPPPKKGPMIGGWANVEETGWPPGAPGIGSSGNPLAPTTMLPVLVAVTFGILAGAVTAFYLKERRLRRQVLADKSALEERFRPVVDADAERRRVLALIETEAAQAEAERARTMEAVDAERIAFA